MDWQGAARRKRAALQSLIPERWRISQEELLGPTELLNVIPVISLFLSPAENFITECSATDILSCIHGGDYTSEQVVLAFCHRASIAHQFTNCLSEINFQDALRRARELDRHQSEHGRTVGILHGLPISVADRFNVQGLESACGFISWLGLPKSAADESCLIRCLRRLGAIPFCKSNVPMSMMMGETANNIIGTTVNPYNRTLSAGGACGGEGALLALKGSPLGFATELAGSSRIPCTFNNLYGLKVSEGRLPSSGIETVLSGLPIASGSVGLMSPDASTLQLAFKALLSTNPWHEDIDVVELPWREAKFQSIRGRISGLGTVDGNLSFGLLATDGYVQPHPTVVDALATVRQALIGCGYDIVEWTPPSHNTATEILLKIFGSTSGKAIRDAINHSSEPPVLQLKTWYEEEDVASSSTIEFWDLCRELGEYRAQYAKYWASSATKTRSGRPVDGVIMPVAPSTAVREGEFQYYAYSAIANVLSYSSCAFPVAFGDPSLYSKPPRDPTRNAVDAAIQEHFRPEDINGAPIGLQVLTQRDQEEKALALLEAVIDAFARRGH